MKKLLHPNVLRLFEVLDDPKVHSFPLHILCYLVIRWSFIPE